MGGVPKGRHTRSSRNQRRSHIHLEVVALVVCAKCGKPTQSHTVCWNCGNYKGREVIDVMAKLEKKEKKEREKEIAAAESEKGKGELNMEELSKK